MDFVIQVQWTAFPLHPDTPEDGLTLQQLFEGRSVDIDRMMNHLKQVAGQLGLPLGERNKTYNSRLAQELAKWAESKEKGDEFHKAVFHAYFVDGKNIGKINELVLLAKSIGLSEQEARRILESRAFKDAVDSDWSRCHTLGITVVPAFVIGNQGVLGFQPYDVLEQLLKTNELKRRV
jgi:predicted DsbA family dithiol-disulfide isomerase